MARRRRIDTRLAHDRDNRSGIVAEPVYHASTVLFADYAALKEAEDAPLRRDRMHYGRMGTPTTRSLEDAVTELDDSSGAVLAPSGLAAVATVLQCFLAAGDHLLMVDSAYGPTRKLCTSVLPAMGVQVEFYDPLAGEEVAQRLRDNTRMLFLESPGSATFEVQDVPALAAVARRHGVLTAIDNTWATPLLFNPLEHGVDLAIQAGTKYLNGHADVMFGVTTTRDEPLLERLRRYTTVTGSHLAPDDAFLARRGLRTLSVRLARHETNAMALARWLRTQPEVSRLLHPAFESCPGHAVFRRDFSGASGLFAVALDAAVSESRLAALVDNLELFGMGYSWGGFESLVLPMVPQRSVGALPGDGALLRIHAGLEDAADLVDDLAQAFAAMRSA